MLRKSPAVIRTHSCASRAPIGCIDLKLGMMSSVMSSCCCTSSIRGSVS